MGLTMKKGNDRFGIDEERVEFVLPGVDKYGNDVITIGMESGNEFIIPSIFTELDSNGDPTGTETENDLFEDVMNQLFPSPNLSLSSKKGKRRKLKREKYRGWRRTTKQWNPSTSAWDFVEDVIEGGIGTEGDIGGGPNVAQVDGESAEVGADGLF